ncbi:hypothetical protein Ndes2526A_g01969 [Nannochloris sp. 'desiccata']
MLRPSHGHLGVLCGAASIGMARASPSYAGIHPLMAMMSPRHVVLCDHWQVYLAIGGFAAVVLRSSYDPSFLFAVPLAAGLGGLYVKILANDAGLNGRFDLQDSKLKGMQRSLKGNGKNITGTKHEMRSYF